ncbi:ester cyclase [Desulfosediminicola ganghwensis]|uniref:ester cyclase n=1 Tax=Desulfosediminicola ganghwensis TaxID=2569540 RepID=UPI00142EF04B|nr:ester cyclase [Desulfosediminicola ganghwensis]
MTHSEQKNIEVVERAFEEVWNEKKAEAIPLYYDPDYIAHYDNDVISGRDLWEDRIYSKIVAAIPDFHVVLEDIKASEDTVVSRWRATGKQQTELFGIESPGHKLKLSGIAWTKLRDQLMIETWNSWSLRDLIQRLLTQVQELSELVPICCYCKKIRNDEGFWKQVELYLEKHLDISLTHGICPECFAKLELPEE